MTVEITRVGPESARRVLAVVRAAFAARPTLDPPAAALDETEQTIGTEIRHFSDVEAAREALAAR